MTETDRKTDLDNRLLALLMRHTPPARVAQTPETLAAEEQALVRAIHRAAPAEVPVAEWWPRFEDRLLMILNSRAWPTVSQIAGVAEDLRRATGPVSDIALEPAPVYDGVVSWWLRFKDKCPWAKRHHAMRLIRDGQATAGQLWRAGYDLPRSVIEQAMRERDPDHDLILDRIRAMGAEIAAANWHRTGGHRMSKSIGRRIDHGDIDA